MIPKGFKSRLGSAFILVALIFNFVLVAGIPKPVYALSPDVVASDAAKVIVDNVKAVIKQALIAALTAALLNLLSYMANKFAYESALWVGTGGNAGAPLYNSLPTQDYMDNLAAGVVAELVNGIVPDNITSGGILPDFGVYLTDDEDILQAMRLGLRSTQQSAVPESDFPEVSKNFEGYLATLSLDSEITAEEKTVAILSVISEGFDPSVSEIGAGLEILMTSTEQAAEEATVGAEENTEADGFKPVVDPITGARLTPQSFVSSDLYQSLFAAKTLPTDISIGLLSNSEALIGIGSSAASIFTNTLITTLMGRWRGGLFDEVVSYPEYSSDYDPFDSDGTSSYDSSRIAEQFSDILSFRPLSITDYSLLSELSTCPATFRGSQPGLFNCAIDTSFASAVARADAGSPLTLIEAVEEGYIDGGWPLISAADSARDQDSKCYTYGFCHSNIVKMRRARVISTGWELAVESPANSESDPITLQEVMDGFHQCNSDGELDDEHPWCHLIDPDWVLKFPDTQCRTLAYGQTLKSAGTADRAEECVDIESCVQEDAYGNCTGGYGYCVREKNIWRFRGDECPEQYASCLSFTDVDDVPVDFLTNTLDYGDCSVNNQGCTWYETVKELDSEDVYDWPSIPSVEAEDEDEDVYKDRIYFNANVETCSEGSGGCSEVIERTDDLRLNMMTNGGFETDANSDEWPDTWILSDATYDTENDVGRTGDAAISPGASGSFYKYGTTLQQSRFYSFSFYAAQTDSANTNGVDAYVWLTDENGTQVQLSGTSYRGDCSIADIDTDGTTYESILIEDTTAIPDSTSYERFECTFTTPILTDKTLDIYAITSFSGADVWIDDVQIEQAEDASSYHAGYNTGNYTTDSVILPPAYLGCTGSASDPDECADYAGICTEQEAGCTLYTPANGDPGVTAVVTELDECPSECSGYDTFRQEETLYEPDGAFPIYFIPETADQCSEDAVGCDEFTNLVTEGKEYYTYLRACITEEQADDSDGAATFYTWEGSDEEGYQLRTWELLESDLDSYSDITHAGSTEVDDAPGAAPCTTWQAETTDGETLECIDDSDGDSALDSDTEDCDSHADIIENPDCREFYDVDGEIHFRQWSDTVTVNNACVAYRKTDIVGDDASEQEDNCNGSGGFFDDDNGECRYFGYSEESTVCSETESGCRQYTGGSSGNSRVALKDLFESGTIADWESSSATSVLLSNESVATDGHSIRSDGLDIWTYVYGSAECTTDGGCDSSGSILGGECTVDEGDTYCGTLNNQLFTGKTYTLSFWAKGTTDLSVGFDTEFDSTSIALEAEFGSVCSDSLCSADGTTTCSLDSDCQAVTYVDLESGWQHYTVGPLDMTEDDYEEFGNGTSLVFMPETSGSTFYIDNVTLREGEDNITVIKDSWVTPASCDENLDGELSAQYHLGCKEYTDHDFETVYLKSFSTLCDEDKVGCDAYYQTNESEEPGITVYNATCNNIDEVETCDSGLCSESRDACSSASDCNGTNWESPTTSDERTSCYLFIDDDGQGFDEESPALCTIIAGDDSCEFDFEDWFIPENLLDTQAHMFHLDYGPDATVVEADRDIYAIVTDAVRCNSADNGCEELGQPVFSADLSVVDSWETVYLMNDPDSYDDILCEEDELFCQEWNAGSEGTWYFKNPGGHTCEYKTSITVDGELYDGWFRDGTNEFCYGTGVCAELDGSDEVSCSSDADCYDTTTNTSYGECSVDTGTYLVGGTESGIWRNGDDEFDSWVGLCEPEYSACTEFQDRLDFDDDEFYGTTDGESYYYIDNASLDETNLLSSQQCNGQVSQKLGCALFNDAGDTASDYNSSATYISSARADELHGDRAFALVDPIDCTSEATSLMVTPDGTEIDLCDQRCAWYKGFLYSDFDLADYPDFTDAYEYGGSCIDNSDCPAYDTDTGDSSAGFCFTDEVNIAIEPDRLENDSNRVLKVTRDRTCSEWLACSSSYTIWDGDAGKYRTICDGIDLCTEYGGSSSASLCSEWDPNDPAVVFDTDRYVSRDVSWYGEEYSGYAVPDIFPIQHLTQVNVAPPAGFCDMSNEYTEDDLPWETYHGLPCEDDSYCQSGGSTDTGRCVLTSDNDYQIGYSAGNCSEDYSEDCTVGYCESTGSACAESDDCEIDGDSCITGVCYTVSTDTCEEDDDCSGTDICLAGSCVDETGNCNTSFTCEDEESTCFGSAAAKEGSCYGGTCFLAVNGNQFDSEVTEDAYCRAQPEADSPFTIDVVTEWSYLGYGSHTDDSTATTTASGGTVVDLETTEEQLTLDDIAADGETIGTDNYYGGMLPSSWKAGFSSAQTCAPGETCECSYVRVGTQTSGDQFVAYETDLGDINVNGVCSSDSPVAGALCGDDDDCRYYDDSFVSDGSYGADGHIGNCDKITRSQDFFGLEGYCLERDTGMNINGDEVLGACVTWFPVDQVSGATDLYAKYSGAGYTEEVYYCGYTQLYMDFYTSNSTQHGFTQSVSGYSTESISCAETHGNQVCRSRSSENYLNCDDNAVCNDGYFALMGKCEKSFDGSGNYAEQCDHGGANDCPYVCVPYGSQDIDTGGECDIDSIIDRAGVSPSYDTRSANYDGHTNRVYALNGNFDVVADEAKRCAIPGVPRDTDNDTYDNLRYQSGCSSNTSCTDGGDGFYQAYLNPLKYPACTVIIKTSNGPGENAAWTDRLWSTNYDTTISTLGYDLESSPGPYGASIDPVDLDDDDGTPVGLAPVRIPACCEDAGTGTGDCYELVPSTGAGSECSARDYTYSTDSDDPSARSYADFTVQLNGPAFDLSSIGWDTSDSVSTVITRMNSIFANFEGVWYWEGPEQEIGDYDTIEGSYVEVCDGDCDGADEDTELGASGTTLSDYIGDDAGSDVRETYGSAPTVWSVDTEDCGTKYCHEDEDDALTVNSTNEGDIEAEGGYYRATLKFFAAADKNQLPIRRIIVDWGDGDTSGSDDAANYYKNHRGLQDGEDDGSDDTSTLSKCDLDTAWGLTSNTCDPNEFNYSHTYRCWAPEDLPTCTENDRNDLEVSPCTYDEISCVYQPKVHVRDNWGWCTGICDDDEGCFDESVAGAQVSNYSCNFERYPDGATGYDPWVYYDGYIYVTP
ncbi:hypothetical protein HON52_03220 [Candidatus Uhrbacteria bacterium]|jgi:hypothetical protein|nr:hypothetical protein [Candidatus Uhrbacteria bacterium]